MLEQGGSVTDRHESSQKNIFFTVNEKCDIELETRPRVNRSEAIDFEPIF